MIRQLKYLQYLDKVNKTDKKAEHKKCKNDSFGHRKIQNSMLTIKIEVNQKLQPSSPVTKSGKRQHK